MHGHSYTQRTQVGATCKSMDQALSQSHNALLSMVLCDRDRASIQWTYVEVAYSKPKVCTIKAISNLFSNQRL